MLAWHADDQMVRQGRKTSPARPQLSTTCTHCRYFPLASSSQAPRGESGRSPAGKHDVIEQSRCAGTEELRAGVRHRHNICGGTLL